MPLGPWLMLECPRVFHETLHVPVLMYGSKTMLWKEKERSRIRVVQMHNLRGIAGYQEDIVPNAGIRELYLVPKGVDEGIDEGALQ